MEMLLIPDPETCFVEPFTSIPTLSIICDVEDPMTRKPYSRDSRYIAAKAEEYLKASRIADTCLVGPEAEFFILDSVRFDQSHQYGFYFLDSEEGFWNSGKDGAENGSGPNLGHKPRFKEGYFATSPIDSLQDIRSEMALTSRGSVAPMATEGTRRSRKATPSRMELRSQSRSSPGRNRPAANPGRKGRRSTRAAPVRPMISSSLA